MTPKEALNSIGINLIWINSEMYLEKDGVQIYAPNPGYEGFNKKLYNLVLEKFNIDFPKLLFV